MAKILISGGCGFVGRHLTAILEAEGNHEIWIIDNLSTGLSPADWPKPLTISAREGLLEVYSGGQNRAKVIFLKADLMAVTLAELGMIANQGFPKLPRFDEVYHLASIVGGRNVIDNDPLAVGIDLGIDSVFFLWAAKVNRPHKTLYASSSAAYPINLQSDSEHIALKESMIDFSGELGRPDYTYGWSKLTGEYLAQIAVAKYNLSVAIVRPFSGYGEDQEPVYPFPAIALRVAAHQNPVTVWGNGHQSRDFVHIDDACAVCVLACRQISDASAVNIGSGRATSFLDLAKRMIEIEGYEANVRGREGMPVGVANRYCDPTETKDRLGWSPSISLDDGIRRALAEAHSRLAKGYKPE